MNIRKHLSDTLSVKYKCRKYALSVFHEIIDTLRELLFLFEICNNDIRFHSAIFAVLFRRMTTPALPVPPKNLEPLSLDSKYFIFMSSSLSSPIPFGSAPLPCPFLRVEDHETTWH